MRARVWPTKTGSVSPVRPRHRSGARCGRSVCGCVRMTWRTSTGFVRPVRTTRKCGSMVWSTQMSGPVSARANVGRPTTALGAARGVRPQPRSGNRQPRSAFQSARPDPLSLEESVQIAGKGSIWTWSAGSASKFVQNPDQSLGKTGSAHHAGESTTTGIVIGTAQSV